MKLPKRAILTVSDLTRRIKTLLEEHFPFVWITGEISNFRKPLSGHYYFTLKDDRSQISAVMFRGQNQRLRFVPEDGMTINGFGRISLYEPRGTYQIILEYLEPGGVGALQLAFEQLKAALAAEGLFETQHKKTLPFLPRKISLITSPGGAVLQDMRHIIARRFPNMPLLLVPVKVQGDGSIAEIVAAIEMVNRHGGSDVAILARGGGSLEDLAAFNSEAVARAVFASRIPIISAVGHETDYTIADFTADMRAPTPSAAAEIAVPVKAELVAAVSEARNLLFKAFSNDIRQRRTDLGHIRRQLVDPRKKLSDLKLRLDDLTSRLVHQMRAMAALHRERTTWRLEKLILHNPGKTMQKHKEKLKNMDNNLLLSMKIHHGNLDVRRKEAHSKLNALSPMAVLQRGYSITRTIPDQQVVRDARSVAPDQPLEILLARGKLAVKTTGEEKNSKTKIPNSK